MLLIFNTPYGMKVWFGLNQFNFIRNENDIACPINCPVVSAIDRFLILGETISNLTKNDRLKFGKFASKQK